MSEEYRLDRPTAITCPECGGAMSTEHTGTLLQFRCHIGHVLSAETMLGAQFTTLEWKLAASLASLNERAELCRLMAQEMQRRGHDIAEVSAAREETLERAGLIKSMMESEWRCTPPGQSNDTRS